MMVSYKPTQGASISIPLTGFGTDLRNSIGVQTVKDDGFIINVVITFTSPAAPHQDMPSQLHPWA